MHVVRKHNTSVSDESGKERDIRRFRKTVAGYFRKNGRDLPWRKTDNPYEILISEVMLQQTQVVRVLGRYENFLSVFPDFRSLAAAPLREVLHAWQGLGYNRRAISLKETSEKVMREFSGILPASVETLSTLPGIGKATASAIAAYAFNKPVVFIETNIRTVFIHFFFSGKVSVRDSEIIPLVERSLDRSDPRQWYYALMDYGVMLKKKYGNPGRRSAHYVRQTPFRGSNRQIRGAILREAVKESFMSETDMARSLGIDKARLKAILDQLYAEGFLRKDRGRVTIV